MKKYFENDELLSIVWRWKKQLVLVFITATLVSAIISSPIVIKPKYKSFAKVYPSNLVAYSEESYSEQMLQFLESGVIRDILISEFNLQKRYEIEDDDPHKVDNLYKKYDENISFTKTKYESVEITVLDESPDSAYLILNRLIEIYNEQVKIVQDGQLKESISTLKSVLETKKTQMDTLEARINYLRVTYGLLDYKSQVKNISKEYYKILAKSGVNSDKAKQFKKELDQLKLKGSEYERLSSIVSAVRSEYIGVERNYDSQLKELSRTKKYANIAVEGYKSDKKVYPVRWLIVSISVVSTMVVAFGLISFMDRINRITAS